MCKGPEADGARLSHSQATVEGLGSRGEPRPPAGGVGAVHGGVGFGVRVNVPVSLFTFPSGPCCGFLRIISHL